MKIFKTKKLVGILGGLLALILTLSLAAPVFAVPQIPHQFWGQVTIGVVQAEAGTTVSAQIGETVYATTTVDSAGRYGYTIGEGGTGIFKVPADDPDTATDGGTNGDTIEFYVNDILATTFIFQIGGHNELNLTITVTDTTSPTVTINQESEQADPTNTSPIDFTVVFSESVSDFATGDVTLGGTAGATTGTVTGSGTTYNVAVSGMTSDGTVTASIAAGKAQDAASNPNEASTSTDNSVTYDTTAPAVTISSTASGTTSTTPIPVTATFTETVTGFLVGDISVTNGDAGNFVANGAVYTFDVTPTTYGEVTVDIAADVAADAAGNNNTAATQFSITYSISPTVVISSTASDPTGISPIPMTATFSETVTGFEVSDIDVTNGAAGNFAGSGAVYTFDVTPVADGAVTVDIAAGVAQDTDTNPNEAATQFSIIYSTETFTITATAGDNGAISPSGAVVVNSGASQAFTITPASGYAVDDVLVDSGSVGVVSSYTFANVTADHTIHATFAVVVGDLGDEIAGIEPGGTLNLLTGTYTGDVEISQSITITGSEEGTIISGSITIGELTDSNVTIENLTITDYTGFGINIVRVRAVDTFIIRNNTILGVEGTEIGIQVDRVDAGGSLLIEQNAISGNETGIKLLAVVADGTIQFNDITSNTTAGLELASGGTVTATKNWWGNISGPKQATTNPRGEGNDVSGNADYQPWLTRPFAIVQADNIAYYGYAWVSLSAGWNIFSTPIALDPEYDQWDEYVALGDPDLAIHATSPAYAFDPTATPPWVPLTGDNADYLLEPSDAIYVRMAQADRAPILYSPNFSVPSKDLYAGWNLVGASYIDNMDNPNMANGIDPEDALASVFTVPGPNNIGYSMVVSPAVNQTAWIGYRLVARGGNVGGSNTMLPCKGYWVFMTNAGTLAGTVFTPVSLLLP